LHLGELPGLLPCAPLQFLDRFGHAFVPENKSTPPNHTCAASPCVPAGAGALQQALWHTHMLAHSAGGFGCCVEGRHTRGQHH
jgi:hypothetical protein